MNEVKQKQFIINYYVWEPFKKQVHEEEDALIALLKNKELLAHAGHVTMVPDVD
jgi:deoxycytidylate deaminase